MKRHIAVFTGTRAEYGLLRPVLHRLDKEAGCRLSLIISGAHLSQTHGHTIDEILTDGFTPAASIPLDLEKGTSLNICQVTGHLISQMGEALERLSPDLLVVLGDRYECLAASTSASILGIPLAHLYGGEVTQGAFDDAFRHAITKMSHLHFTSTEAYRRRIIQLGESPEKIFTVGALGVENALSLPLLPEDEIRTFLGVKAPAPYILSTFHPVTLEQGMAGDQLATFLSALEKFPNYSVIFTGANADPEGNIVNERLKEITAQHPERLHFFHSLGSLRYLSAAQHAVCVIGNSSSGIIEIPSLGTPVIDVGNRQKGRERSLAVLHCDTKQEAITEALRQALSPEYNHFSRSQINPYEKTGTTASIVNILLSFRLDGILNKHFHDLNVPKV